jgi:hypothetical protein
LPQWNRPITIASEPVAGYLFLIALTSVEEVLFEYRCSEMPFGRSACTTNFGSTTENVNAQQPLKGRHQRDTSAPAGLPDGLLCVSPAHIAGRRTRPRDHRPEPVEECDGFLVLRFSFAAAL